MVALDECHMKYEWWLNELLSLGIVAVHRRNEFNDLEEISDLVNNLKESYYTYYQKSPRCTD
jgi:hypothetical protein